MTLTRAQLLACCGSEEWADRMLARWPFRDEAHLLESADGVWWELGEPAWLEAFSKHPRIGETKPVSEWSAAEQAGMRDASVATAAALRTLNETYEKRFGWIFLVCANGKSAEEMRHLLEQRLSNSPADEIRIAAGEQAKITRIRIRKLLGT